MSHHDKERDEPGEEQLKDDELCLVNLWIQVLKRDENVSIDRH